MDFDILKDLNTTVELHEDLIDAYEFRKLEKELWKDKDAGAITTTPVLILNKLIPLIAEEDPYLIDKTLYEYNRFTFNTKLYITAYYNPADFNILRHSILNKGIEIRANTIGDMFLLNTIVKGSIRLEDVEYRVSDIRNKFVPIFGEKLSTIYPAAFTTCKFYNFKFSNTLTSIGDTAFGECSGLPAADLTFA